MAKVTASKVLDIARKEIGKKATDTKKCKYNTWFYGSEVSGNCYDWCAVFVCWVFAQAGASNLIPVKSAGCGELARGFNNKGKFYKSNFKAGDIVFFHWSNEKSEAVPGAYTLDHVGIIEKVNSDGTFTTIEGNTGNSANGEVMRRIRSASVISGVARPVYGSETSKPTAKPTKKETAPNIYYKVRTNRKWLPEVKNCEDYAGLPRFAVTDIAVRVDKGTVKYRVHIRGGNWLPYVTGYNVNDHNNGYAGNGREIDAVEIIYYTDKSKNSKYYYATYRVSPVGKAYYDWQKDNLKSNGMDGYAGAFGKAIDRLQIKLTV